MTAANFASLADERNLFAPTSEWLVVAAPAPRQSAGCIEIMHKRHFISRREHTIIQPRHHCQRRRDP